MIVDIEVLQALYLSPAFKAKTPLLAKEKVFRVGVNGGRHYQRESNGRVYKSLTTFLDSVMPPSKILQTWRDAMAFNRTIRELKLGLTILTWENLFPF